MALRSKVLEYNRELRNFLEEIWGYVPKGRRKQLVKNARIKALLDKFKILYEE